MVIWCSNIQIMWKNVWKLKHFRVQSYLNQPSFLVKLILNFTSFRYLNNLHQGSRRWMTENKWGIRIRRMMAYTVDNLRSSRSCIYTRYTKTVSFQMEVAIWAMNITILETHTNLKIMPRMSSNRSPWHWWEDPLIQGGWALWSIVKFGFFLSITHFSDMINNIKVLILLQIQYVKMQGRYQQKALY